MTPFELERRDTDAPHVVLVQISGELDLTNARELEEQLDELSRDASTLVLDLNRVLFIDSAALHVLFRTARALEDGRFGLVLEPTAAIARTLAIVGMPQMIAVRTTVEELLTVLVAPDSD
ncbi:MAG TPA: anti-sigma factor antagonist [Gaiellaceae bacterium]|nr:anti-sigma factor antagonist [Gaiellaceae bacterium]